MALAISSNHRSESSLKVSSFVECVVDVFSFFLVSFQLFLQISNCLGNKVIVLQEVAGCWSVSKPFEDEVGQGGVMYNV